MTVIHFIDLFLPGKDEMPVWGFAHKSVCLAVRSGSEQDRKNK